MFFSNDELNHIWQETLNKIKEKLSNPSFKTWFSDTKAVELNDKEQLIIEVPNDFIKDWLQSRYINLITEIIRGLTRNQWEPVFLTRDEIE
ncbi:MAG: chromosomal replication initiator protein DnaA, partial [Halanaerobiaceae bacterium]|nr:chromosomal replication initiator protein DnaA [Halanaerobiaceae bacterium]